MVFDDLVLHDTHTRFGDRHFRERDTLAVGSESRGGKNFVHLLLAVGRENFLRFPDLFDFRHQGFDSVDDFFVLHETSP